MPHQRQQKVFGADVVVAHPAGLLHGELKHALRSGGKVELGKRRTLPRPRLALDQCLDTVELKPNSLQNAPGNTPLLTHQPEEQVLRADVAVLHPLSFFLRQAQHPACALSKALHFVVGHNPALHPLQ